MSSGLMVLLGTGVTVGFLHTLLGPDHYVPFIAMASAARWSAAKTALVTVLCGIGHILGSVALGLIGVSLGFAVEKLQLFESARGEVAAWMLIAFGLTYFIWGIHKAIVNKPHTHAHFHMHDGEHEHEHSHTCEHVHVHESPNLTPWVLFTIFVFGPCEVLIPMMMFAYEKSGAISVVMLVTAFGSATIAAMLGVVMSAYYGIERIPTRKLQRFSHALAGLAVLLCGGAVKFLGL